MRVCSQGIKSVAVSRQSGDHEKGLERENRTHGDSSEREHGRISQDGGEKKREERHHRDLKAIQIFSKLFQGKEERDKKWGNTLHQTKTGV